MLSNHSGQVHAVHLRHHDVGDDQLNGRTRGPQDFERLTDRSGLEDTGAGLGQEPEHGLADYTDIVDDQYASAGEGGNRRLSGHEHVIDKENGTG